MHKRCAKLTASRNILKRCARIMHAEFKLVHSWARCFVTGWGDIQTIGFSMNSRNAPKAACMFTDN